MIPSRPDRALQERPDGEDPRPGDAGGEAALDRDKTQVSSGRAFDSSTKTIAALVVLRGPELGRHYPLRRHRVVLGRGDTADIVLQDKEISRAHAAVDTLRLGDDMVYRLSDLGSTNHLFVNGTEITSHLLEDGDKIQLGDIVLRFELLDALDSKFHTEIRNRIHYDDLSGLLTYESFRTALEWEIERQATSAKGCAVVMMDLDDFKKVNDTHGHLAGSMVLREIGGLIRSRLRHFDVAARYGGEEFVAYLPETSIAESWTATQRLRREIANHEFVHHETRLRITISMGISHYPQDGRALERLVQVADDRLYRAKREGKDRVVGDG